MNLNSSWHTMLYIQWVTSSICFCSALGIWSPLPVGEQLYRAEKLPVLRVLPARPVDPHGERARHINHGCDEVPGIRRDVRLHSHHLVSFPYTPPQPSLAPILSPLPLSLPFSFCILCRHPTLSLLFSIYIFIHIPYAPLCQFLLYVLAYSWTLFLGLWLSKYI